MGLLRVKDGAFAAEPARPDLGGPEDLARPCRGC